MTNLSSIQHQVEWYTVCLFILHCVPRVDLEKIDWMTSWVYTTASLLKSSMTLTVDNIKHQLLTAIVSTQPYIYTPTQTTMMQGEKVKETANHTWTIFAMALLSVYILRIHALIMPCMCHACVLLFTQLLTLVYTVNKAYCCCVFSRGISDDVDGAHIISGELSRTLWVIASNMTV